jgi:hypothetical protein
MRDYIPELGGVRRRLCSPDHQVVANYGMRALIGLLRSSAPLSRRAAEISVCYAFLFVACTTDFVKQLPPSIVASKDTAAIRAALLPYITRGDSIDAALRRLETIGFHCERLTRSQGNSGVAAAGRPLIHCAAQTFGQPTLYYDLLISDSASHVRSFGLARNVVDFHMSDSIQAKPWLVHASPNISRTWMRRSGSLLTRLLHSKVPRQPQASDPDSQAQRANEKPPRNQSPDCGAISVLTPPNPLSANPRRRILARRTPPTARLVNARKRHFQKSIVLTL